MCREGKFLTPHNHHLGPDATGGANEICEDDVTNYACNVGSSKADVQDVRGLIHWTLSNTWPDVSQRAGLQQLPFE